MLKLNISRKINIFHWKAALGYSGILMNHIPPMVHVSYTGSLTIMKMARRFSLMAYVKATTKRILCLFMKIKTNFDLFLWYRTRFKIDLALLFPVLV
jgi:hypothetical protein